MDDSTAIEDGYFLIDSDDSWDIVDDLLKPEGDVLLTHDLTASLPGYSSLDSENSEMDSQQEGFISGILSLAAFNREVPPRTERLQDIVKEHVLPFLPAKSLCRFRAVCKDWDKWITSPFFAHRQALEFQGISGVFTHLPYGGTSFTALNRRAHGVPDSTLGFLPEQVIVLASHNGLLCCCGVETSYYYVCNPVTKKQRRLPTPNFHHGSKTAVGLVLDVGVFNFRANFEIVCVIPQPDSEFVVFEIYSSRTDSWRNITAVCLELQDGNLIGNSFYRKGYVYWMVDKGFILVFDVKNEEFGIIELPVSFGPSCAIAVLGGELCFLEPWTDGSGNRYVRIYGDLDMRLKDTIQIHINRVELEEEEEEEEPFRVLGLAHDNDLLLLLGRWQMVYDLKGKTGRVLDLCSGNGDLVRYLPYVNSLVDVGNPCPLAFVEDY
ncbi:hypothetical protein MLD38_004657 [Melastoma candidum]|uniref:Uncharacterized protein n=1 Tax=Melastoma candidum TaxID=119954 RepID=A0ACB9S774_9MYRT|nr:hypothetical protein MLD38_004657 [Melastoma candidum]